MAGEHRLLDQQFLLANYTLRRHLRHLVYIFVSIPVYTRHTADTRIRATRHSNLPRANHFNDPDWTQKLEHALDLVLGPCNLDDDGISRHIHDASTEDLGKPIDFRTAFGADFHLD